MPEVAIARFSCPSCARVNVWKPAIAGKGVKCNCGYVMTVPASPGADDAASKAALKAPSKNAFKAGPAAKSPATPPAKFAVKPPVKIEVKRPPQPVVAQTAATEAPPSSAISRSVMAGIPYRKGLQPEAPPAASKIPPELRDVVLPIALIVAGFYATATDAMQTSGSATLPLSVVIGPLMLNIAIGLSLAVAAVLGGSMMAGIAFHGPMWQNILKLCSVALLPLAIGSMAGRAVGGINGDIVSSLVSIACYFGLFWAVFTMAWSDRTICVVLIWIIRSGVAYMIFRLTANGSPI